MHHGGMGVEIIDCTHEVVSSSLNLNGLRCFSFSLLSHKGLMITEISNSGKARIETSRSSFHFGLAKPWQEVKCAAEPAKNDRNAEQDHHHRDRSAAPYGEHFIRKAFTRFQRKECRHDNRPDGGTQPGSANRVDKTVWEQQVQRSRR